MEISIKGNDITVTLTDDELKTYEFMSKRSAEFLKTQLTKLFDGRKKQQVFELKNLILSNMSRDELEDEWTKKRPVPDPVPDPGKI